MNFVLTIDQIQAYLLRITVTRGAELDFRWLCSKDAPTCLHMEILMGTTVFMEKLQGKTRLGCPALLSWLALQKNVHTARMWMD